MKKNAVMFLAMLLVVAIAVPAFAAVEFKYGGQFRARWISTDNVNDGTNQYNDNENFIDQRTRLFFTFIASENLRLVTKFEIGDTIWGRSFTPQAGYNGRFGPGGGVGADAVNVETKNAYVEFNIPATPVTALVGVQGVNLLNSWIIDDDFSAAVLKTKLAPWKFQVGYVAGQNNNIVTWQENIDSYFLNVEYEAGPLAAALVGYYQDGHNTTVSADPAVMQTPVWQIGKGATGGSIPVGGPLGPALESQLGLFPATGSLRDNQLFDLGGTVSYKLSWMSAYATFVKNLGSVEVSGIDAQSLKVINDESRDYTGWMVDAGANFFCGPYSANIGGFYTTGAEIKNGGANDIDRFVYPAMTSKYFSEIIGGGVLDHVTTISHTDGAGVKDHQWTGYQMPSNIWTVTVGGAWQALEKTKVSASYWYFGTSEDVVSGPANKKFVVPYANDIGHELNFYVTQGIVDGLTLDLVGAYLITGDAYNAMPSDKKDDVYELGARIQWNF